MKITINGFRNIEQLEYEIVDGKHNFLFGLSGSGKSSIAESIKSEEHNSLDKTFGKTIEQSISINGKDRIEFNVESFNGNTKNYYFSDNKNQVLRLFLFDKTVNLEKTQNAFTQFVQSFLDRLNTYLPTYNEISKVLKDTKSDKLTKSNSLKSGALTNKVIAELRKIGDGAALKKLIKIDAKYYSWFKEGIQYYDERGVCPFCNRTIRNTKTISKISDFKKYDEKIVGDYKQNQESLERIVNHHIKEDISSIEIVGETLVKMNLAVSDFDKFNRFLVSLVNVELFEETITNFTFNDSANVERYFKGIGKIVSSVNKQIDRINRQYDAAREKTEKALKNKSLIINQNLELLDIPYVFKVKYVNLDYNEYYFIHKDNPEAKSENPTTDNYSCMSEGEKTIVSLLLFIEQCKKEKPELIIFDDPVSSYDEYRRSVLLKIIQRRLSGQTVLILSHDQVFAKCALFQKNNCRGRISYLNHFCVPVKVEDVGANDFVSYREYALDSANKTNSYLLKVAYIRSTYEANHRTLVYKYLSAILHAYSKSVIINELGTTKEKDILKRIEKETNVVLVEYDETYLTNINFDLLNYYEKCMIARSFGEEGQPFNNLLKDVFDELSDYLHVNQTLEIGLNPSKYYLCSRRLYKLITNVFKGVKSLTVRNDFSEAA